MQWSGPGDDRLEHADNVSVSSRQDIGSHSLSGIGSKLLRVERSTSLPDAELYVPWSPLHKSSRSWHGSPWYWMASTGGNLRCWTHSIRSQGRLLDIAISVILSSKKVCLACLIACQRLFQFSLDFDIRYIWSVLLQLSVHQGFEQAVIFKTLEWHVHTCLIISDTAFTCSSNPSLDARGDRSRL